VAQWVSGSVVENALAIAGFSAGILLGVFLLGIFCRGATQSSVVCGMLVGLTAVALAQFRLDPSLAWPWFAVVGATATFITGWGISWVLNHYESK